MGYDYSGDLYVDESFNQELPSCVYDENNTSCGVPDLSSLHHQCEVDCSSACAEERRRRRACAMSMKLVTLIGSLWD